MPKAAVAEFAGAERAASFKERLDPIVELGPDARMERQAVVVAGACQGDEITDVVGSRVAEKGDAEVADIGPHQGGVADLVTTGVGEQDLIEGAGCSVPAGDFLVKLAHDFPGD